MRLAITIIYPISLFPSPEFAPGPLPQLSGSMGCSIFALEFVDTNVLIVVENEIVFVDKFEDIIDDTTNSWILMGRLKKMAKPENIFPFCHQIGRPSVRDFLYPILSDIARVSDFIIVFFGNYVLQSAKSFASVIPF